MSSYEIPAFPHSLDDYRKEKYYQVFTEEFNTNLLLFEKSRDWSDFIQVLQKLLKVCRCCVAMSVISFSRL